MFISNIKKITTLVFLILSFFASQVYAEAINNKNILVLGDSLSAEYGLESGSGWVELIKNKINDYDTAYQITNISISGETTKGGLERLKTAIKKSNPKILIIELGANDALQGLDLQTSYDNLQQMINLAKNNNTHVLLIGMLLPPNYGKQYTQQFANMFTELANKNSLNLVPFLFAGFETKPEYFQLDNIHPNEKAQSIMANNVWAKLKDLM